MNAFDIKSSVTTVKTSTRTLNLDPDDVEAILLNWAVTHYGFTHAEVSIHGLRGYTFTGVHISEDTLETTIDPPEDEDDGVAETKPTIRQGIPPLGRVAMYEGNEPHKSKKIR
jgi:hypothetical protein